MKEMAKLNTLSIYENMDITGETTFFFNGDKLITGIDGNDGNYRSEYMDCLFESFGVKVNRVESLTSGQKKEYLAYCKRHGIKMPKKEKEEATAKNFDYYSVILSHPFGYQDMEFFIKKDLPMAKEFIETYQKILNEKDQDLPDVMGIRYHFEAEAVNQTKASVDNYKTCDGYLGYRNMVLGIIHPQFVVVDEYSKKTYKLKKWMSFSDVAQYSNFYYYVKKAQCFDLNKSKP
jgi:hypothetical protein